MAVYDLEKAIYELVQVFKTYLNTELTSIQSDKNDGITLKQLNSSAFFIQDLNGKAINYNPFFLAFVDNISSIGQGGFTADTVTVKCLIAFTDENEDLEIYKRLFRYQRALKQTIEQNFSEIQGGLRLEVESLAPDLLKLANSSRFHRAVGIQVRFGLG